MRHIYLSPLLARVVFAKTGLSKHHQFSELRHANHGASGLTLPTGAKLYYSEHCGYHIGGYSCTGEDVQPYEKYAKKPN